MQRDWVLRAQRGDRESFGVLADTSIGRLYNIAKLMLADADLAQDAVQEALIQAWRDLRALRDPDRFDPWLHRILVHCVYRVAKRERREVDRRRWLESDTATPDPAREFADRDEIDRGFRRLTPEFRAVLVIHHYLGLPDEEAAEILSIPLGTFKSRLHRATSAMRAVLDADTRGDVRLSSGAPR